MTPQVAVPVGDPTALRAAAAALDSTSATLSTQAGSLTRTAQQIIAVWRSLPSAPRATARLTACADLVRSHPAQLAEVSAALRKYADALELAQSAARYFNWQAATLPSPGPPVFNKNGSPLRLPPVGALVPERATYDARMADLAGTDRACAAAIRAAAAGLAPVPHRLAAACRAAIAAPATLGSALAAALSRPSPDLTTVEEVVRQLALLKNDPDALAAALATLGPVAAARLAHVLHTDTTNGFDRAELAGILAGVCAVLAAERRPVPTPLAASPKKPVPTRYVVQPGDTLSRLADYHGTTVAELLRRNPQLAADPDLIAAGAEIRIT